MNPIRLEPLFILVPRWLEALRSGRFLQVDGYLADIRKNDGRLGHCCLGVLCEVAGYPRLDDGEDGFAFNGLTQMLPDELWKHMGLKDAAGTLVLRDEFVLEAYDQWEYDDEESPMQSHELAAHNDGGVPFDEIANIIEAFYRQKGVIA